MCRIFLLSILLIAGLGLPHPAVADVRITTWNIEHLGSDGRGFGGGFGGGNIPRRSEAQLKEIADFIENTLQSDIVAIQEVARTGSDDTSNELDIIVEEMGEEWDYILADVPEDSEMVNGYLWNSDRVNVIKSYTMDMPNIELAGKALFDRRPLILYFETLEDGETNRNDMVLVNVHLASGQSNDENHAIAMIAIEHALTSSLKRNEIKESDRVILGDFNDNPDRRSSAGNPINIPTMYLHMEHKGYTNIVDPSLGFTRMDANKRSLIDHILVNNSADNHVVEMDAERFLPGDDSTFAAWRQTFSDHFPLSFEIKIGTDDDVDF